PSFSRSSSSTSTIMRPLRISSTASSTLQKELEVGFIGDSSLGSIPILRLIHRKWPPEKGSLFDGQNGLGGRKCGARRLRRFPVALRSPFWPGEQRNSIARDR